MSSYSEFLAVKALREQVQRGAENEIYKLTTPAQRQALDIRYFTLAEYLLEQIRVSVKMTERK